MRDLNLKEGGRPPVYRHPWTKVATAKPPTPPCIRKRVFLPAAFGHLGIAKLDCIGSEVLSQMGMMRGWKGGNWAEDAGDSLEIYTRRGWSRATES